MTTRDALEARVRARLELERRRSLKSLRQNLTTEWLLTSSEAFNIAEATPAQLAACRVLDGRPLEGLAKHADVRELLGGPDAVKNVPGRPPREVCFLAAIRGAKTIISCAAAIRMSQTVDLASLGPGEIPRVSLVSLKLDVTAVPLKLIRDTMMESRRLRALVLDHASDTVLVRHPSGRPVEIKVVAGARAGGGLVARWSAGAVFDEAPRMTGREASVVNLEDARTAVIGRLLPGAQALYIGSPWAPYGPVFDMVEEGFGHPTEGMVVMRGTGPMLNPKWWTPERCDELAEVDPLAYQTDVMGEFADPEAGLLNPVSLKACTRKGPVELPFEFGGRYAAAIDPSDGESRGNPWTLVVLRIVAEQRGGKLLPRAIVAYANEWRGTRPDKCLQEIAAVCKSYQLTSAATDQYASASNRDLARRHGLALEVDQSTQAKKVESYTNLATFVHTERIELPAHKVLIRDLRAVKKRVTQGGYAIVLPKTTDGRHCDFAPALAGALKRGLGGLRGAPARSGRKTSHLAESPF